MTTAPLSSMKPPSPKRRRRAPTTGATEDCHSCRKRQTPCDRRRPYCSQCVELGKECSGYRTTLTWGVGVASRGKLRGMALPVVNAPQAQPSGSGVAKASRDSATTTAHTYPKPLGTNGIEKPSKRRTKSISSKSPPELATGPIIAHPRTLSIPQDHRKLPVQQVSWQIPHFGHHRLSLDDHPFQQQQQQQHQQQQPQTNAHDLFHYRQDYLHPIHTGLGTPFDETSMSSSTGSIHSGFSISSYSDQHYDMTPDFPPTPDDAHFSDPFVNQYSTAPMQIPRPSRHMSYGQMTPRSAMSAPDEYLWVHEYQDEPSSAVSSAPETFQLKLEESWQPFEAVKEEEEEEGKKDEDEEQTLEPFFAGGPVFDQPAFDDADEPIEDLSLAQAPSADTWIDTGSLSLTLQPHHMPTRLRSHMDFYDKAICPVLVAFDDHTNPYRAHILPLAMHNDALKNALAALATNNVRMRKLVSLPCLRRGSSPDPQGELMAAQLGNPSAEEQHYKSMSIELLNAQLADPEKAKDDAVLATLLILCLFHVCDSGFSKFKTQLAGVQKLLRMRGGCPPSAFAGWVEMFFAWFDVMTSAVNDRETQIEGDSMDLVDLSNNLGALEQFSGCEGRLFKLIARLGRLNLLSQGRPVRELPRATMPINGQSKARDYYSLPLDMRTRGRSSPSESPTERQTFWREWNDIRQRLQEWELDSMYGGSMHESTLAAPQRDLLHISESFRYSALLYTERLAYPTAPSSSPNLQNLVSQGLYHINQISINSCVTKFMLWPLFIVGTECVVEEHRDLVRERCIEIQKESGFYNNVSGLEVLERVWKDEDEGGNSRPQHASQAFQWRKAMDRMDGEYIVI